MFRNRSGTVVAGADVYVRCSAIDVDRYAKTDGLGAYSFSRVAQGNVTVVARDPASRLIAASEAGLGAADARIDLALPESIAVSGAAATVLGAYFPADAGELERMAQEAAMSRLFGGIHFRHDNEDGLALGRKAAAKVLARFGGVAANR